MDDSGWLMDFFWETPKDFWSNAWNDYMGLWKGVEGEEPAQAPMVSDPERAPVAPGVEHVNPFNMQLPIMENFEKGMERRRSLWDWYEEQMNQGESGTSPYTTFGDRKLGYRQPTLVVGARG